MVEAKHIAAASVGAVALSFLGYAVYFDYKRRNDPAFRRSILRESKRLAKEAAQKDAKRREATAEKLQRALVEIRKEPMPKPEQQEKYFLEQLATGEALAAKGPDTFVEAASFFYKALRVYPAPSELITIYESTQPAELFSLIMAFVVSDNPSASAAIQAAMASGGGLPGANVVPQVRSDAVLEEIDDESPSQNAASRRAASPTSSAGSVPSRGSPHSQTSSYSFVDKP